MFFCRLLATQLQPFFKLQGRVVNAGEKRKIEPMLNFRSTLEFPEFDQALLEASQRSQRLRSAAGELNLGNGGTRQTVRVAQLLHATQNFIPARPDLRFSQTRIYAAAPGQECEHIN